jgi:DNA-binding CsgD family transcriptional regulator
MTFETYLDSISRLGTESSFMPEELALEVRNVLHGLGGRQFAALTTSNLNKITRAISTFASQTEFFGRDLTSVFDKEILDLAYRKRGPIVRECGLALMSPFDRVSLIDSKVSHFLLLRVYKDRFTHGYFVVFGEEGAHLGDVAWDMAEIAHLTVGLMGKLRVDLKAGEKVVLTAKEIEALRWTYDGKTAAEAADLMGTNVRNVNYYTGSCIRKLAVQNKIQAAVRAKEMGYF